MNKVLAVELATKIHALSIQVHSASISSLKYNKRRSPNLSRHILAGTERAVIAVIYCYSFNAVMSDILFEDSRNAELVYCLQYKSIRVSCLSVGIAFHQSKLSISFPIPYVLPLLLVPSYHPLHHSLLL